MIASILSVSMKNGTIEEVKKIVNILNDAQVPSQQVAGNSSIFIACSGKADFFFLYIFMSMESWRCECHLDTG